MEAIARVYVNNIEVGTIPASQYEKIRQRVRGDWRLYLLQGFNTIKVLIRFSLVAFNQIPWLWFLLTTIGVVFLSDSDWQATINAIKAMSLGDLTSYGRKALVYSWVFNMLALLLAMGFHGSASRYGFVSHFDDAVSHDLRHILEVPTEGDVMVSVTNEDITHDGQ